MNNTVNFVYNRKNSQDKVPSQSDNQIFQENNYVQHLCGFMIREREREREGREGGREVTCNIEYNDSN